VDVADRVWSSSGTNCNVKIQCACVSRYKANASVFGRSAEKQAKMMNTPPYMFYVHGFVFVVWAFLVAFGTAMEVRQMQNITLDCPCEDGEHGTYSEDGICCMARFTEDGYDERRQKHENAYRLLSVVGGTIAAFQIACGVKTATDALFRRIGGVVYVFHQVVSESLLFATFVAVAFVYQHLVYHVFFCQHNQDACDHPPREGAVVRRLFHSLLALSAPYLTVQLCRVTTFSLVFVYSRRRELDRVVEVERMLRVFDAYIDGTFNKFDRRVVSAFGDADATSRKKQGRDAVRSFFDTWMSKNDEDVGEHLNVKAEAMMLAIKEAAMEMDTRHECGDEVLPSFLRLNYAAFRTYFHRNRFGEGAQDEAQDEALRVWRFMVQYEDEDEHEEGEGEGEGEEGSVERPCRSKCSKCLTCAGVRAMLYDLFFRRKELIHSIYTDHHVICLLSRVAMAVLLPASFVAVSRIFGYHNAFGTGVDLFKTYLLAASYVLTGFKDNVAFVLSMLFSDRPFNLGDVLQFEGGDTYKVRRITLSHVFFDGPHHVSTPVARFMSVPTVNLSKQGITDSLRISVPLSAKESEFNRDKVYGILRAYQTANERDIQKNSLRCGWADVSSDGATKVMQCNWRYNFRVFDRSRLNWARTDIRHHIVRCLVDDLANASFRVHVAGGGGFNSQ